MYLNENYKNYKLIIYQGTIYKVNSTILLRFVRISIGN